MHLLTGYSSNYLYYAKIPKQQGKYKLSRLLISKKEAISFINKEGEFYGWGILAIH